MLITPVPAACRLTIARAVARQELDREGVRERVSPAPSAAATRSLLPPSASSSTATATSGSTFAALPSPPPAAPCT